MRALEPEISRERDLSTAVSENPTVIRRPFSREPLRIFAQTLYFCKLESLTYILPLTVWVNLYSIFGTLRKTIFFARVRFDRSRASKVIDCGTNRKRVCDFLLVRRSNLGPILHLFGDIAGFFPYSAPILGVFPLHQMAHVGVSQSRGLKLFGREIIFEEFQPM